ncbi:MAG: hypothetical protein RL685_603 [Pseudomonadota bacterium]|jgi:hypothetical protein
MKNQDAQQTETTLSDESLAQVTGGGYVTVVKGRVPTEGPVVKSQGPIFDVDFDYPKVPFNQPR